MTKSRLLLLAVFGILIIDGLLSAAVWNIDKKKEEVQSNLQLLEKKEKELDKLSQQYGKVNENMEQLIQSIPGDFNDFSKITQDLTTIASQSNQVITIKSNDKPEVKQLEKGEIGEVEVMVELKGSFRGLINFLTSLFNAPYYTEIKQLDIGKEENSLKTVIKMAVFTKLTKAE